MRRSFALIFNDRAGVPRPHRLARVLLHLEAAGAQVTKLNAATADDATQQVAGIAKRGAFDAVIAAGGDGTVRAAAAGAAGTKLPVGYIPLGTGNVLRHETGLSVRPGNIARVLLEGPELGVRLGLVNGAPFVLMAGVGFDGRVVAALDQNAKRRLGRLAYGGLVLKALGAPLERLDIEIDGARHEANWIVVTKASHYGGPFVLTRAARLGAETMAAVLVKVSSRGALFKALLGLALGRLERAKGVEIVPCAHVRITASGPAAVQADGDDAGATPCEIVRDGPVARFIVPPDYLG